MVEGGIMKIREIMYFWVLLTLVCVPTSALGSLCPSIVEEEVVLAEEYNKLPTCPARHISSALSSNARCRLHTTVVTLPWPNSTLVQQMTPTHVAVQRCTGGCHGVGQGCAALATRQKEVSVMVGKCGVSVGKCEKECATVTLEEHTKCGCGCQLDRADCELDGLHRFKSELCQCECLDIGAKRSCLEQGRTWSESSCTCGCAAATQCLPGWTWETKTCTCVEMTKVQQKLRKEEDSREKMDKEVKLSWELILITGLLSLLGVLLLLVVVLAVRLRRARKEERSSGRVLLVPSTLSSGHYVPGADPCSDLKKSRKGKHGRSTKTGSESGSSDKGGSLDHRHGTNNDNNEQLTDSSLCSSEQEKEVSGGSCESLPPPLHNLRHHHGSQPCLQSVGLSRHLAIRTGPEGGSLRLQRPPRHLQPYPGPGDLPPKPYGNPPSGERRPSQTYLPGVSHYSGESPLLPGHSYRSDSPLQPLPCPNTYYNSSSASTGGTDSPYNTVKIVYKKGERRMELSCQMEPSTPQWSGQQSDQQSNQPMLQITENPSYCSYNM